MCKKQRRTREFRMPLVPKWREKRIDAARSRGYFPRVSGALGSMKKLRVVLASPRHAGNVGACARLVANFGVTDWGVTDARCDWRDWGARKFATGVARDDLDSGQEFADVTAAVSDRQIAVAFTRRQGWTRVPSVELAELPALLAAHEHVALVFGNEETGLTREEVEPCTHLCAIPTSERMPSMNLSHAVAAVLGLLATAQAQAPPERARLPAAVLAELEGMYAHWREFLCDVGLVRAGNPERMLGVLRRLFDRGSLSRQEIRALRGILSKAQVALGTRKRGKRLPDHFPE
jgi:tRNA/rRNA methyltransferase